jgi:hypothetical protein
MKLSIKIKEGLNDLPFHCSPEKVREVFSSPFESEELDNPVDGSLESLVWNYEEPSVNFFFDTTGMEPSLMTIESEDIETELFGKKIFQLNLADILLLMKNNGYGEFEEEDETWGEHRITFDDAQLDFYFEQDELSLVSWSTY